MGNKQRGFLSLEYTVLIVIFVAALLAMSIYLKRSYSGKWRQVGDSFGFGRQYYFPGGGMFL